MPNKDSIEDAIHCRPGFEDALCDEIRHGRDEPCEMHVFCPGLVIVQRDSDASLKRPFVFERQRIEQAGFVPLALLKPIADDTFNCIMGDVARASCTWSVQAFVLDDEDGELNRRIKGIANTLLRLMKKAYRRRVVVYRDAKTNVGLILQLCLTPEGLWYGAMAPQDMVDLSIGGHGRVKADRLAPSRSHMKVEEAFMRMAEHPVPGQSVIDLGAAPGGWTYAFLKRGCHVTAVDSGPLRLPDEQEGWGTVQHLRSDGITFAPKAHQIPVDWMVSDMLIPPGVALGLLRKWVSKKWAKRMVCNIKIPQQNPFVAIAPIIEFLEQQKAWNFKIRQFYHDRREVTITGIARKEE